MATRKRRAENLSSEAAADDNNIIQSPVPLDPDEHLLPLPGSRRALISLTGKGFERALLWRLDWYNYMYFLAPFLFLSIKPSISLTEPEKQSPSQQQATVPPLSA